MAQPFDRLADLPSLGELDRAAGQFWVGNPWQIVSDQHNLSAYERNRTFLNLGNGRFADVSHLTGADSDGDGRAVIGADLNGDGMEDLVVRQAGGGPLLLFQNRFPKKNYVRVSLRGTRSNGLGVGARVMALVGSRHMVREMFPANTYMSQQPCEVHFGLGDAKSINHLTIQWPSGLVQELNDIPANQHIRITEGESAYALLGIRQAALGSK